MGTKVELLSNLLHEIKEILIAIQKERFDLNADEKPLKTKKRITDGNFQKLIKLKNEDFNKILTIQNEILALDEKNVDFNAYKNGGMEEKIAAINKCFDQTFAVVDQMKRETEFIENTSTEFEDESTSMKAERSSDFFPDKNESDSYGDSNSNSNFEDVIQDTRSNNDYIKEVFGKPLTKALASVILYQPNDPIDYLSKFLHNYRELE